MIVVGSLGGVSLGNTDSLGGISLGNTDSLGSVGGGGGAVVFITFKIGLLLSWVKYEEKTYHKKKLCFAYALRKVLQCF